MWTRSAAIVLISSLFLVSDAGAASFTRVVQAGQTSILLTGDIVLGDAEQLRNLIAAAPGDVPATTLRLDSPGGNLVASVALAKLVRGQNLNTIIGPNASCASACFLIFASGNQKYADYASFIGVHGVADKDGRVTADSQAATVAFAQKIRDLGAPPSVVEKLLTTPPFEIVQLTPADLRGMGTIMTGRPVQGSRGPSRPLAPAQMPSVTIY